MDLQKIAQDTIAHFTTDNPRKVWVFDQDKAPKYVLEMMFAAHDDGKMLPDDFVYQTVVEVLDLIADGNDPDELELQPDAYHSRLLEWVGSNLLRMSYVDEAIKDFGCETLSDALMQGQHLEKDRIAHSVVAFLRDLLEREGCEQCGERVADHTTDEGEDICGHCYDEYEDGLHRDEA